MLFILVFVLIPVAIICWWAWCVVKFKRTEREARSYKYRRTCVVISSIFGVIAITWLTLLLVAVLGLSGGAKFM